MPRYVAFLRGVSPMNARMPELQQAFEAVGFTNVRTVLSSGNVVFDSPKSSPATLERKAEKAMNDALGHSFLTIVRSTQHLQSLLDADPFAEFELPREAKRVVTLLRGSADTSITLPPEKDGARILRVGESEVLAAYVPSPKGPAFMTLLERTFGKAITTRTIDTVRKCAIA